MKKQFMRLSIISLLVFLVVVSSTTIFANRKSLENRVLQKEDLPRGSQYYAEPLMQEHFYGVLTPVNIPLQNKGFQKGYAVNAVYPVALQDDYLEIKTNSAFVLNIAYQYQDEAQALTVFEQQIQWFLKDNITVSGNVERIYYEKSLESTFDIKGSAYQLTYMQEGLALVNYWFLGVKENTVILLMVDGISDSATRHVFDSLLPIIMAH